jgi:uncharacterized protein (TIRG00374 family)
MPPVKSWLIKSLLSLLAGVLFVWLACRGIDFSELHRALRGVSLVHLWGYFVILSLIHLVRTWRWGLLLRPLGGVSWGKLLSAASIGFMALMTLPLRLGELVRPMLVAERGRIRISAALATVALERVIDSLVMAALLAVMLLLAGVRSADGHLEAWAAPVLGLFVLLLVFLALVLRYRQQCMALAGRLIRPFSEGLAARVSSMTGAFIDGLKILPDLKGLSIFVLTTLVYWTMSGAGLVYMFGAFEPLRHFGWREGFFVLSVLCVGLMIPAGPGMIGNFHYFVKIGLGVFAGPKLGPSIMAYAIVVHAMQLGQQAIWGLIFWLLRKPSPGGLGKLDENSTQ